MNAGAHAEFNILHASHIWPGVPCQLSWRSCCSSTSASPSKYRAVVHRISIFFKVITTRCHHSQDVAITKFNTY